MIVVTGAGGKTGQAVIAALAAREAAVRAFVRREEQGASLRALGAQEIAVGDLRSEANLRAAMSGAEAVYHIGPNVHPEEQAIGLNAVGAARVEGVGRFVYHSVLHPQTENMPHHWRKLRVEEAILASGLSYSILQPAPYMQNLLAGWAAIVDRGVYTVPYPVDTRLSLVDLWDVAEAASIVLTQPGHEAATYEIVGTRPLSQVEVAAGLSEGLARPVEARAEPVTAWEKRVRASGLGSDRIATLKQMFEYYARHGLAGNPNVLGWLLGRPPTILRDFVARTAQTAVAR
jgi:NAD(P)H dehydrogenase (quinone)